MRTTARVRRVRDGRLEFSTAWLQLRNPHAPVEVLTEEQIETIHDASMSVLEDVGMRIQDEETRKNSRTHAIPVPSLASELIEAIKPNEHGWFPSAMDPSKSVSHNTLYSFIWRQRDRGVIPTATNRDLRRTWKTLAGKAGISKEIRARIQSHALHDVNSKSYDRWNYMPEKREGMQKWDKFVRTILSKGRGRESGLGNWAQRVDQDGGAFAGTVMPIIASLQESGITRTAGAFERLAATIGRSLQRNVLARADCRRELRDKRALIIDCPNGSGFQPFLALGILHSHLLPLRQRGQARTCQRGGMNKDIFVCVGETDEAKSLFGIVPLHCSLAFLFWCVQLGAGRRISSRAFSWSCLGHRAPDLQHLRNLKSLRALFNPDFQLHSLGDAALARSFERPDMQVGL